MMDRLLRDRTLKDYTIDITTRLSRYTANPRIFAKTTSMEAIFSIHRSESRTDIALLASAVFLQRFSLPFQRTFLALDIRARRIYFNV
jgi:hypothetical protein